MLNAPREMLIEKTDLEEETVDEVIRILKSEFEEEGENSVENWEFKIEKWKLSLLYYIVTFNSSFLILHLNKLHLFINFKIWR